LKKVQTDNSFLSEKIKLRIENLPNKKRIRVLNAYNGDNAIWSYIQDIKKNISVIGIDIKKDKKKSLIGDNIKFLMTMDLSKFDIIDLDAYGCPIDQLEILFERRYNGIIFVTFIQSGMGNLPKKMLNRLGYTNKMIEKIPTIFSRNGFEKMKNYLSTYCVNYITCYNKNRKHYFVFKNNPE